MIYGIDEVGRGAWAGPLVLAGVSYQWQGKFRFDDLKNIWRLACDPNVIVGDSKKLTRKSRDLSSRWLCENVIYQVVEDSADTINKIGISKVWDKLVLKLVENKDYEIIIDGSLKPDELKNVKTKIKGDISVWEIAAASILAKVYRDNLMVELAKSYEGYGWERNVGYGTREHREGIKKLGLNNHHRKLWVRNLFDGLKL